jgi:hypothetical protein
MGVRDNSMRGRNTTLSAKNMLRPWARKHNLQFWSEWVLSRDINYMYIRL